MTSSDSRRPRRSTRSPAAVSRAGSGKEMLLLRQRRFAPFFWTQLLGALNDNVYKVGFTSLLTYQAALFGGIDGGRAAFAISAVFIAPFVLFSATAGQLADKYDRAFLTRLIKTFEIGIMAVGAIGFLTHTLVLLYACVFMMGMHSTLFGPVKYAYLPQHLSDDELVRGNGMVEMGTFIAILVGTIFGGEAAAAGTHGAELLAAACLVVALVGRGAASLVPASPSFEPALAVNWNPFTETWRNLRLARRDRTVFVGLIGISWLWFVGATFLSSFFSFAKDVLDADSSVVTLLLALFSVGIGIGSVLCARLASSRLSVGLVPLGAIGMSLFSADLYFASHGYAPAPGAALQGLAVFLGQLRHWRILADLLMLAASGGLYSVPLYALIQRRSRPTHRARIIAANNILNSLFMIVSSVLALALFAVGVSIPGLFGVIALLNAAMTVWLMWSVPMFGQRFVVWMRTLAR